MSQATNLPKLEALFKEEQWGRIEPSKSLFIMLDDLFNSMVSEGLIEEAMSACRSRLENYPDSVPALYLLGLGGYQSGSMEDAVYLRRLTDIFLANQKWSLAEAVADRILDYGENAAALRTKAVSLEQLGRGKEAVPVFEELLKLNRSDTDAAKKLALALAEREPEKSISYLKLAVEGCVRKKDYASLPNLWNKLIPLAWQDMSFFERIERMLADDKQTETAVSLLKLLLDRYRNSDADISIMLLKKILLYKPDDVQSRKELIKVYREKYGDNSRFEQFIKLSGLNNFKTNAKLAVQDFENYIIFAAGNYVYHNSWKLGKIASIDSESVVVDFKEKENHRMSMKMALQSLTPVKSDHLYAVEFENAAGLKELFDTNFMQFFEILVKSYGGEIHLSDIKRELIPKYIDEKAWAKWWSSARTAIKKSPLFGVSDKKRDVIYIRERPVTYIEELIDKFAKTDSFSSKLDLAIEFVNNAEDKEGADEAHILADYFLAETKGHSNTRLILSYFILRDLAGHFDHLKIHLEDVHGKVTDFVRTAEDLPLISIKITSYDHKKDFVNLIESCREDWPSIVSEILFETPIRIHRYIFNTLLRANAYNIINEFIDRSVIGAKEFPDIFLWAAKNLLNGTWKYEWLDYSKRDLLTAFFRLMSDLRKIETDGSRLKSQAVETLFAGDAQVFRDMVNENDKAFLSRFYDLVSGLEYVEDFQKERLLSLIREKYADFVPGQIKEDAAEQMPESFIVTEKGFKRKEEELDRMTTTELNRLSKELAAVADANADPKENVEYAALLEKQAILKLAISKLDEEIKTAVILDPASVSTEAASIGTKVGCEHIDSGEVRLYTILGPWDTDSKQGILSYRSLIAKAILGKKLNEEFSLKTDDDDMRFRITSIERADF